MAHHGKLPPWLKPLNRVIIPLNRLGLALGTQHVLSIPGRTTGKLRSTPVSLLTLAGQRYIVTAFETDWVKNARGGLGPARARPARGAGRARRGAGGRAGAGPARLSAAGTARGAVLRAGVGPA